MFIYNQKYFNKIYIINFFISILPLSLILGNLVTNINIFLICVFGIIIYKKDIFFIKKKIYQYLVYVFFIYLLIITAINNSHLTAENNLYTVHLIKSFFYLRFLIIFLIITKLIDDDCFRIDLFFISCSFFSLIVSVDIIVQVIFKKNLIGLPLFESGRASGLFGDELIAGGFIQKFAIFFIFYFAIKYKSKINSNYSILLLFLLFLIPLIFTLNRMPIIIFLASFIFYFLIEKKIKEIIVIFFLSFITFFILSKTFLNNRIFSDIQKIQYETNDIFVNLFSLFKHNELKSETYYPSGYVIHFNSGVQVWKENKIFGHGLKSFRLKCKLKKNQICNTHPHNYVIEIMVDVGVIGLFVLYLIFIFGIIDFLKYYNNEKKLNSKLTSVTFFLLIFFEFFPFRTTGSFFTTSSSSFIFLMLPIFLNINKLKKLE